MNPTNIKTVAVLGAGTMGRGIAQVFAQAGYKTLLFDVAPGLALSAVEHINEQAKALVTKGKRTGAWQQQLAANLETPMDVSDVVADLVIEAVAEKIEVKQQLFIKLEKINDPSAIFATNTSSLSVTDIAVSLKHRARFVGIHFFNPAPQMPLVEIIPGAETDPDLPAAIANVLRHIGKEPVVSADTPGFIVNRVARHFYLESLKLLEEKTSDESGLDALMRSAGFRMGPFELMDLIGIDINYAVTTSVYHAFERHPRFKPSTIQQQKVEEGNLGRKTGKGFFDYTKK